MITANILAIFGVFAIRVLLFLVFLFQHASIVLLLLITSPSNHLSTIEITEK